MRLLIVEDNQAMRDFIRSVVRPIADEITECGDGDEACEAYARTQPDWVLMDVQMPRMDGITATRELKAAFPQARVLIVTDSDEAGLRAEARDAGACGYVLKENLHSLRQILGA